MTTKHTNGIEELLSEGPQAYCSDENGNCYETPEAAELDRLRAVNEELVGKYEELVKLLRYNPDIPADTTAGDRMAIEAVQNLYKEAADAITALEAENARLQSGRNHYRDALVRADVALLKVKNERLREFAQFIKAGCFNVDIDHETFRINAHTAVIEALKGTDHEKGE